MMHFFSMFITGIDIYSSSYKKVFLVVGIFFVTIIAIKIYIWDPLITKWFFSLQLKSKSENAKSIYLLFT